MQRMFGTSEDYIFQVRVGVRGQRLMAGLDKPLTKWMDDYRKRAGYLVPGRTML